MWSGQDSGSFVKMLLQQLFREAGVLILLQHGMLSSLSPQPAPMYYSIPHSIPHLSHVYVGHFYISGLEQGRLWNSMPSACLQPYLPSSCLHATLPPLPCHVYTACGYHATIPVPFSLPSLPACLMPSHPSCLPWLPLAACHHSPHHLILISLSPKILSH